MLYRLLLLFIVVPLLELTLLLMFAELAGSWVWSVLLVLASGMLGAWLARRQGSFVIRRVREQLAQGKMPTDSLLDGALIFFAGGLLLTPGIMTDLFGISLMIPRSRRWHKRRLVNWFNRHFQITQWEVPSSAQFHSYPMDEGVVEGEVVGDRDDTTQQTSSSTSSHRPYLDES